ncbi:uncharacterized protein Dwil_GK24491 [Drosophila willistoni]|uniref:Uncharacterized protein n=1 Tax=Drosophila willistoni TaxID=7260 RepID=B4N0E5_DROWI|nr:uncharacterized protein F58A4.6 [Drosophila willistoni]EDW77558.1 uncharacterized protein Dwil_GK24491 [Drosophila willistoni]
MTLCICDYFKRCHFHDLPLPEPGWTPIRSGKSDSKPSGNYKRRLKLKVDAISGNYWLKELQQQRVLFQKLIVDNGIEVIWLELHPPAKMSIDYKWANMLAQTIWQHIQVEQMMSWLSTLGGGYSALGEQFERCAENAGKISQTQLKIGLHLGNPFLQARCKLFYSISLIQRGKLRHAKHLIRRQYKFAKTCRETDRRLLRMCRGIWLRLQFEYHKRYSYELANKKVISLVLYKNADHALCDDWRNLA